MKKLMICFAALLATAVGVSETNAQMLTFDVTASDTVVGGTVNWSISVTASGAATDGIATASVNLNDTGGNALSTAANGGGFPGYFFAAGTPVGNQLIEVAQQSFASAGAVGKPTNLGPFVFATGSFSAGSAGTFELQAVGGTANRYWNIGSSTVSDYAVAFNNGSYTVTAAIPEPGSFAMFGVALLGLARRKRR